MNLLKVFNYFRENNAYLFLLVYCGIAALLIRVDKNDPLKSILVRGTELKSTVSQAISTIDQYFHLKEENEKLTLQNAVLLSNVIGQNTLLRDTSAVNRVAEITGKSPMRLIPARVVDRRFDLNENMLIVNAGINQGVKKDMAVLTPDGLVGRITQVSGNYAQVLPILHSEFGVIVFSDTNKTHGILKWDGKAENAAQLHYIPLSSSIEKGEMIYTADFSTFAVRGIPVGEVIDVTPEQRFFKVDIRLNVDFSTLTYVLIAEKTVESEKSIFFDNAPETGLRIPDRRK